jgi:hypothetical protein
VLGVDRLGSELLAGGQDFLGNRAVLSRLVRPEQASISYIKPDIIVFKPFPSNDQVVAS